MKRCRCRTPLPVDHASGARFCETCGERIADEIERFALGLAQVVGRMRERLGEQERRIASLEAQLAGRNGNGSNGHHATREQRRALHRELRRAGKSIREIARASGESKSTVARDLHTVPNANGTAGTDG